MKVDSHTAPASSMRKLCPNLDREDGLDTVLEVPIPEEMFVGGGGGGGRSSSKHFGTRCTNMMAWMRAQVDHRTGSSVIGRNAELQLMLGVVGAPLVPIPMPPHHSILGNAIKEEPIVSQLLSYSPILRSDGTHKNPPQQFDFLAKFCVTDNTGGINGKIHSAAVHSSCGRREGPEWYKQHVCHGQGEDGGDRAAARGWWQQQWRREEGWKGRWWWGLRWRDGGLCPVAEAAGPVVPGAGGVWLQDQRRQQWQDCVEANTMAAVSCLKRAPKAPSSLPGVQGLDPKSTANLFNNAVCIGEKTINNHDCFVLRLDAEASTLRSRSSSSVEIIRHTLWGYFSQRTALLVHLEDSHLLRIKTPNQESVYWETTMESSINDYRPVDGVQIAHAGRTSVSLFRFGETEEGNTRTRMEETWTVEEVDFNIWGLSMDCFLPPGDIKEEKEGRDECPTKIAGGRPPPSGVNFRIGASQIAAVNIDETME